MIRGLLGRAGDEAPSSTQECWRRPTFFDGAGSPSFALVGPPDEPGSRPTRSRGTRAPGASASSRSPKLEEPHGCRRPRRHNPHK
eukprot:scaffold884_cov398-Prasinococcus_capsulatus_cf.AAC.15